MTKTFMDILAHGLWTAAGARAINLKLARSRPLNPLLAAWWGVFPDFFAFTFPFLWMIVTRTPFGRPDPEPPTADGIFVWRLASLLYNLSHSAIVFVAVISLVYLITRNIRLELFGWLLHILIDIPTHSYRFFPTPFLWPISGYKFNGLSWADPRFMLANYGTLIVMYLSLYLLGRKK